MGAETAGDIALATADQTSLIHAPTHSDHLLPQFFLFHAARDYGSPLPLIAGASCRVNSPDA